MSDEVQPETRPSLMTPRERVEHHTATGNLPAVIPGLLDRLAVDAEARQQAHEDPRWSDEERERLVAELEASLHPDVADLIEQAVRRSTLGLDQEEGELRTEAGFGAEIEAATAARASLMVTTAADPTSALDVFADAEFTGDADLIRAVGGAVLSKLRQLASVDKGKPLSDARDVLLAFEMRWQQWKRAHPTPRERVALIERERHNRRVQIEESAKLVLRLHGIGRPATPPPQLRTMPEAVELTSQLREGPNFDVFANRLPGRVRR